jgi:hypothetical protein
MENGKKAKEKRICYLLINCKREEGEGEHRF